METVAGKGTSLFNSTVETGLRALVLLEAIHPRPCGLAELTWFDHLVVHTGDLHGPESLHPDLPGHTGELLVRRRLVEDSLRLMQRVHLVEVVHDERGILYLASEEAPSFVDLLQSRYNEELKLRASWVAEQFASKLASEIEDLIAEKIGRWTAAFRAESQTGENP